MSKEYIAEQKFYTAEDVAKKLGVSHSTGYRIIKKLNNELRSQGYITISGKISKRYFEEKVYM